MVDARIHAQWCACENLDAHQPHTKAKKATIPHLIPPSIYAIMYVLELDLAVESASHQYEWGNDLSNESFWPFWPFSGMVAKGEIFFFFTLFEKWKWKRNDWKSRSRSENEIKMTRDREVKFQKKISRIETLAGHCIVKPKSICSGFVGSAREGQHCIFTSRKLEPDCLMPEFYLELSYLFNMYVSVQHTETLYVCVCPWSRGLCFEFKFNTFASCH